MRSVVLFQIFGDHLHSSSDFSDNDKYDNWQENDVPLIINIDIFVLIHHSGKKWLQSERTL